MWLFSFVDLAFLLLIALTQMSSGQELAVKLGEIVVPKITTETEGMPSSAPIAWQLRVHPREDGESPFELMHPSDPESSTRITESVLRAKLAEIALRGDSRPVLAPDADSRSQDLLTAVSLVEESWPQRRRATVTPLAGGPNN
ncbi:MAG TPA: hypothetical protein VFT98_17690 [Myxococcota bacterium]|nr:hypothetical protein [Myxococcota bacterium]